MMAYSAKWALQISFVVLNPFMAASSLLIGCVSNLSTTLISVPLSLSLIFTELGGLVFMIPASYTEGACSNAQ